MALEIEYHRILKQLVSWVSL